MAKQAKTETDGSGSAVRSNGYDPEQVKSFVSRVENLEQEVELLKVDFKEKTIGPLKEDIKQVVEEAEQAGIPKKELKAVLKRRAAHRKAEAIREKLKSYEQTNFDNLRLALGDLSELPLGAAALSKAGNGADARTGA